MNRKTAQNVLRKFADTIAAEDPTRQCFKCAEKTPKHDISERYSTAITPEIAEIFDGILTDNLHKKEIGLGKQYSPPPRKSSNVKKEFDISIRPRSLIIPALFEIRPLPIPMNYRIKRKRRCIIGITVAIKAH